MNKLFYENSVPEMYATLFYGLYDGSARRFTYCNAGHNPPLVFHRGSVQRLDCGGTVVGMFSEATWAQASISLHPADVVVAYSDGIVELAGPDGEEFGEQRLIALLQDNLDLSASRLRGLLLKTVASFGGKDAPRDDMTLAILKVT